MMNRTIDHETKTAGYAIIDPESGEFFKGNGRHGWVEVTHDSGNAFLFQHRKDAIAYAKKYLSQWEWFVAKLTTTVFIESTKGTAVNRRRGTFRNGAK